MKKFSLAILFLSLLSSCTILQGQKTSQLDYLEKGAKFDVKSFFNGNIDAFAITQDSSGKIIDTETVKINGSWEENKGVIKQSFVYASGGKDSRTWLITLDEGGNFTAIGHDVAAPAQGKQVGNAMQMIYALLLPGKIKGEKSKVSFEDKVYLVDENSAIMISSSSAGFGDSKKTIISLRKLASKSNE
jgi:hypothetical protein